MADRVAEDDSVSDTIWHAREVVEARSEAVELLGALGQLHLADIDQQELEIRAALAHQSRHLADAAASVDDHRVLHGI
ncbi:hypothetical protein D3C86_1182400 [compost metagenome]